MLGLVPKWVRFSPNGTNQGLFRSDVSTFALPKCTELWCSKVLALFHLVPNWPIWIWKVADLSHLGPKSELSALSLGAVRTGELSTYLITSRDVDDGRLIATRRPITATHSPQLDSCDVTHRGHTGGNRVKEDDLILLLIIMCSRTRRNILSGH